MPTWVGGSSGWPTRPKRKTKTEKVCLPLSLVFPRSIPSMIAIIPLIQLEKEKDKDKDKNEINGVLDQMLVFFNCFLSLRHNNTLAVIVSNSEAW